MEILQAFGIHEKITKRWQPATDEMLWLRGKDEKLMRTERLRAQPPYGIRWTHGTLQQGEVEEIIKRRVKKISSVTVEYDTSLCALDFETSQLSSADAYPCLVSLQSTRKGITQVERVRSKYVIGADGGKSTTRALLGFDMLGEQGSSIWGVMDFKGASDFPDFGATSIIRSDIDGAVDFVRREDGLVRMYVELNKGEGWENITREEITPELISSKCRYLLRPYTLEVNECLWWSAFTATQRFSNATSKHRRVFLVGDAIHTHSPLTGMGMNTSIQDSYNLAWKLAGVIKSQLKPEILDTYSTERGPVAQQLLEADRTCLDLFATPFGSETSSILERAEDLMTFLAGRGICYSDPFLTSSSLQELGVFKPGVTLPEEIITNHATGRSVPLHNCLKADGAWSLIVFAGDISCPDQMKRLHAWVTELYAAPKAPLLNLSGLLDTLLVHCAPWNGVNLADFPPVFLPMHEVTGRDYDKIYLDEGSFYVDAGMDRKSGGAVLVRPDRHIGWVGTLDGIACLEQYLSTVFQVGTQSLEK
ncbi:unnamed protein product [Penicillium salamii]|nr:unnamed protein product [Penicillium salamii]CAG8402872.1 unnamed protein product [Penicillium salamii]